METFLNIDYPTLWFLVVGAVFSGYAILDGFDLGAGSLHLFLKTDKDRRIALNAVGPVWDGNEVWLVIGGGTLFAGFPVLYATLLSAMYIPFMLFLLFIILRAIAIEFRSKENILEHPEGYEVKQIIYENDNQLTPSNKFFIDLQKKQTDFISSTANERIIPSSSFFKNFTLLENN